MWFATGEGLNRFDGRDFVVFKSRLTDTGDARFLDRNINSALFEDTAGRLWMSTDIGVSGFDCRHSRFLTVPSTYGNVFALLHDTLYAWCVQNGLYMVNVNNRQRRFQHFRDAYQSDLSQLFMIQSAAASGHTLWIADDTGLIAFDTHGMTESRVLMPGINGLCALADGRLLLPADNGIFIFDPSSHRKEFIPVAHGGTQINWRCCVEDTATRSVYFAALTGGVICRLSLATREAEFIDLPPKTIYALYIDHSRNLWVGTDGDGVYKLDIKPPRFACFVPPATGGADGLMVKSIWKDTGDVWMGSCYKGVLRYNVRTRNARQALTALPLVNKHVASIFRDSAGLMVIAADDYVYFTDAVSGQLRASVQLRSNRDNNKPVVYKMTEWKRDHFLAATNVGLFTLKMENGNAVSTHYFWRDTAICSWTYNLYTSPSGDLYMGKRNRAGFIKFRMTGDTSLTVLDKGFYNILVRHFYKCSGRPLLWLATEKGLIAYNEKTKQFKVFDETDGLRNSSVYSVLALNDSCLWISTNRGLSNLRIRYAGDKVEADISNYTTADGLQSDEFNTGASFTDKEGFMYFGGIAGINWFDPRNIHPNPFKAIPAITQVWVEDKPWITDTAAYISSVTLPFDQNTIGFSLAALEFTQPGRNQFAYMLDGLDKKWVNTTGSRVRYAALAPGTYTFMLKAANNDGVWNMKPLRFTITVLPPFWETWWFRLLILVAAVGLALLSVRMYIRQKVRVKTRELEKQQALFRERTRISKDVHDDLGSGLSKISLIAEIAQQKAGSDAAVVGDIRNISAISKELVENMRDLIWVLNPANTTLEQLVVRIREYCSDYLEHLPITASLDFAEGIPCVKIAREAQRNIFLTIKEAINNCVKHAGASDIRITIRFTPGDMEIVIADNGRGFEPAQLKRAGNGLRNMKNRVEATGGTLELASSPGGTVITIQIPLNGLSGELPL